MARHAKRTYVVHPRTVVRATLGSALAGVLLGVLAPLGPLVLWAVGL